MELRHPPIKPLFKIRKLRRTQHDDQVMKTKIPYAFTRSIAA